MTAALQRLVTSEARCLHPDEAILAAGRAKTVRGTDSANMFPESTLWALSTSRLLVFVSGSGRGANQLAHPIVDLDLGSVVTGARVEDFNGRDVLLVVQAGDHPAMVLMEPGDAQAIAEGIESALNSLASSAETSDDTTADGAPPSILLGAAGSTDGDERVGALRLALRDSDFERARSVLVDAATPEVREYLVDHVHGPDLVAGIEAWVEAEPESADAYLIRGANALGTAFERRRIGGSDEALWSELRNVERNLFWAVELAFDDPVAFTFLVRSGLALGISVEELCMRYDESVRRCPDLLGVHVETLLALSPLGRGSLDDMFLFARTVARAAAEGSPLHSLVPFAHLIASVPRAGHAVRQHYFSGEPTSETEFFAMMSVDSQAWVRDPVHDLAVNIFAAAFAKCGDLEKARSLVQGNGAVRSARPWSVLPDGEALYGMVAEGSV